MRPSLACLLFGTALTSSIVVNVAEGYQNDVAKGPMSMDDSEFHIGQVVLIEEDLLSIAADILSHKTAANDEDPAQGEAVAETEEDQKPALADTETETDGKEIGKGDQTEAASLTAEADEEAAEPKEQQETEPVADEENKAQDVSVKEEETQDSQQDQTGAVDEQENPQHAQSATSEQEDNAAEELNGTVPAETEEREPDANHANPAVPDIDDVAVAKQKISELDQSIQQEAAKQSSTSIPTSASNAAINTAFTFSPITLAPESSKLTRKPTATSNIAAVVSTQTPSAAPQVLKKVKSSASVSKPTHLYLAMGTLLFSICIFSQYF